MIHREPACSPCTTTAEEAGPLLVGPAVIVVLPRDVVCLLQTLAMRSLRPVLLVGELAMAAVLGIDVSRSFVSPTTRTRLACVPTACHSASMSTQRAKVASSSTVALFFMTLARWLMTWTLPGTYPLVISYAVFCL